MCIIYGAHFQSWTFCIPRAFCLREVLTHTDTAWGHDLLLYCPHLEEREERPILKMASNGGILSSSTKIFRREKVLNIYVYTAYIKMMPWKSSSSFSVIAIMIAVPNVGVALRQIASSISVPTSNKSPISLLYCNCIQMIRGSDDDANDFNALGAWCVFGGFFFKGWIFGKVQNGLWPPPPHLENHIAISLQFHVHPSWKLNLIWIIAILIWTMTWAVLKIEGGVDIDRIDKLGVAARLSLPNRQISETTPLAKNLSSNLVEICFFVQSVLGSWPLQP